MPEFKNKEEYAKWKADRLKAGKENQDKIAQEIPFKTSDVKPPSFIKKTLPLISLVFILLVIFAGGGYIGYKYYTSHQEKKQRETKRKVDEEKYMVYLADAREVSKQIGAITSGLEVGYNYMEFSKKVADMNYAYSKFLEKYKSDLAVKEYISYQALDNAGEYLKSAVNNWKHKIDAPTDDFKVKMESMVQADFWAATMSLKIADEITDHKNFETENNTEKKAQLKEIADNHFKVFEKYFLRHEENR